MLSINNLTYYIGGRPIYEKASLHIKPRDKIGLIGLNGTGKTTLLRLITGEYQFDGGEISKSNDCSIGFLNQDLLSYQSDESILHVAMQAFEETMEVQRKIDRVLKQMETNYEDKLVNKLTQLQEQFESMDGYTMQSKAEEILEGIGFSTSDLSRPLNEFSGGWRMRVMLAKLLLEKPSLLMLDEPTNHLDLPSIQWIEQYLRAYEGAVIIVSHDRQFLNNTIKSTVEVSNLQLNYYGGNYSFYLKEKALRSEIQQNAFDNQQQMIKQTEKFIERFRAKATKARQVQSRVKALERLDRVEEVVDTNKQINFKFEFQQKSGRFIINLKNISKAYGEQEIFKNTTTAIERGDKIALIGANGRGKSTLLRIIAGSEPVSGERTEGYNVIPAFYAQHQLESLNVDNEILEELKLAGSGKTETELRNVLGCFLFSGEDVFKKIKVLSGGEKSRVALAKTLISEANFLLLDEPTNHLDIQSENILIQALQQYKGSFIIVSHNRHFIAQTANKVWYIENQEIKEYPGTYEEYEYWRSKNATNEVPVVKNTKKKPEKKKNNPSPSVDGQARLSKLHDGLSTLEKEITGLDQEKMKLEDEMSSPNVYSDPDKLAQVNARYEEVGQALAKAHKQWEDLASEIDLLEGKN